MTTAYYPDYVKALIDSDRLRWNDNGTLGSESDFGLSATLPYSFMNQIPGYYTFQDGIVTFPNGETASNFQSFTPQQEQFAIQALAQYESIANINFYEVPDQLQWYLYGGEEGTIKFGYANRASETITGWSWKPSNGDYSGDVWINNNPNHRAELDGNQLTNPVPGTVGFHTLLHELGHAIAGLNDVTLGRRGNMDNAGIDGMTLSSWDDNYQYTIMSYNDHPDMPGILPRTLMLYDIAALQAVYGTNWNSRTGNDLYSWTNNEIFIETIWDGGGIDTIDASNQSRNVLIDLNPGSFSSIGGTYLASTDTGITWQTFSAKNNLAIAYDVTIENAKGGLGNDTMIGNSSANDLYGEEGDDLIYGASGELFLSDVDNDWIEGGNGNDTLDGSVGHDSLFGGYHNDVLYGNGGRDYLYGEEEADFLDGGLDSDFLYGSYGNDSLYGSDDNDYLYGGSDQDYLDGGHGHDYLEGGDGNDLLLGETYLNSDGNDTIYGGNGDDYLHGVHGNDFLYGEVGHDVIYAGHGNDYLAGGSNSDSLYGWTGNDILDGGEDNDVLNGFDGTAGEEYDLLYGGVGVDTLVLGGGDGIYYQGLGYATIQDWDWTSDYIQVFGSPDQYTLGYESWTGSSALDTTIYYSGDLIGVVQDSTNVYLWRDFIGVVPTAHNEGLAGF